MKVTIELTDEEVKFVRSFCILRATKHAVALLVEHAPEAAASDCMDDLDEAGPIYERIRSKLVQASYL